MYRKLDALDKKVKPLILTWLADLFGYKDYPHSFKDQYINWSIWDNHISVSFDLRQEEQVKLISLMHPRFLGAIQSGTLKIVNEKCFYMDIERLGHIKYPKIINSKRTNKTSHKDNDGDIFYTYDWEVFLEDETSIYYHNQTDKMDLEYKGFTYNSIIQERFFVNYLIEKPAP